MTERALPTRPAPRRIGLWTRLHARRAALGRGATAFAHLPEPRAIGRVGRGQQLLDGRFLFTGYLVEASGTAIWDLPMPSVPFESQLHRCEWLDDLAATGETAAEALARDWTMGWIARFGRGTGPGWAPSLTGRRVARWIDHAQMIVSDLDAEGRSRFMAALGRQARFLSRRWHIAAPGMPRLEALNGWLSAALVLDGFGAQTPAALRALTAELDGLLGTDGSLASRNPEELLEVFTLATRARANLVDAGAALPDALTGHLHRAARNLRALRHADGGLARFHGGGRGVSGRLDQALAASGVRPGPPPQAAMGYARLSHGRATLIMDAAAPPQGAFAAHAHASALAFELTSGRRPLIVNCGAGHLFGDSWRRAGRATPSHSTLAIDGYSSARLGADAERLTDLPTDVRVDRRSVARATGLIAGHDGYVATHGLTHVRQVFLSDDGRGLSGEDVLATVERADEDRFDRALARDGREHVPFRIRFHLHPDVTARMEEDGCSVAMMLKSGELWVFRHGGAAAVSIEPSVYLDAGRAEPQPTRQIVLTSAAADYATRVSWTLAKGRQTPDAVRDLAHDDRPVLV